MPLPAADHPKASRRWPSESGNQSLPLRPRRWRAGAASTVKIGCFNALRDLSWRRPVQNVRMPRKHLALQPAALFLQRWSWSWQTMGQAEQPTCVNGAFLSARLLWQLVSQTRVVISVLKTDRAVRRKVSIQTIYSSKDRCSRDIPRSQRNGSTTSLTVTHTVKRRKSRWRRPGPKKKFACYLCRLENTTCNDRPPPYSEYNHLSRKCSLVYLPIHETHPPTPPARRSSLPYVRRGSLYLFSNPSPQLPVFPISQRDAYYFQYLVSQHTSPTSPDFKSPIWGFLLQVTHFEPSLRHLVLATAMMHQSHHVNICVNYSSIISSLHLSASKHCSKAVRLLSNRLSKIQGRADTVTWELSFMACYLFTEFQSILGNEKGAHVWLKRGFRLLKAMAK